MNYLKSLHSSLYHTTKGTFILCLLYTFLYIPTITGQSSGAECSQSKVIVIPFVKDTGIIKHKNVRTINRSNPYEQADQFSYWYKLNVEADASVNCQITPINKNDRYAVYIYKYSENDFCEKLLKGKIKHVRVENEENQKSIIEASESSDFEFDVFKGEQFYFSILTVSKNNCGHKLQLIAGADTLQIISAHAPCIGAVAEKAKQPVAAKVEIKQTADTILLSKTNKKSDTVTVIVKEKNKAIKITTAKIKVSDVASGKPAKVIYAADNSIKLVFEKGKKYTVECTATGYKEFNHLMVINEYITPDSNQFIVFMKPLKAGDNFVMDNIYFFPNTYALKDGSKEALNALVNYLVNNPEVKIELQGHTNGNNKCKKNKASKDKGPEWNFSGSAKKLSLMRAEEIKEYLVKNGANKDHITTVGFGGEKMIVANPKSPEAIKKNARVEVVIIDDGL